ncbi:MAG: DUF4428 domain-containing protein [Ruminococcus sp.]|nr:DUF4428 domain-containing protein [Ruminococcus sp.]
MGLFDKKYCSICGEKIGLLGNRKLEDGNLCKNCAAKLSPFFSDRRNSTVEDIKEQLAYREENKNAVAQFRTTRTYGSDTKILLDEDKKQFIVTRARNIVEANPDVLDYAMVTGVDINIDEDADEEKRKDAQGNYVSYNPPRYTWSYDFELIIHVNHPYFDSIKVQLNSSSVSINDGAVPEFQKPNPEYNREFKQYDDMCKEIKDALLGARQQARDEIEAERAAASAAPTVMHCPYCGANTTPDSSGCCQYCGSPLK